MHLPFQESENFLNFSSFTHKELVHFIGQHPENENAWREFYRRFHQHICLTVGKAVRTKGHPGGIAIVEDLVQEVYKKLIENNCKALRVFMSEQENGIFKYLQVISIRIVLNDIVRKKAQKQPSGGGGYKEEDRSKWLDQLNSNDWLEQIKHAELIAEIESCLGKILRGRRHGDRDLLITHYYLYEDLKPDEIASITRPELSSKRVSNIVSEILEKLRDCLKKTLKE